jgi:hypothetical protein
MDLIRHWFGQENIQRDWERVRRFWNGEGRCLANITLGAHRPRQDTTEEARFPLHRASLEQQARVPGLNIPSVFSDYGTVSNPKYWGGELIVAAESGNPHIHPAATSLADALKLSPRSVDDPTMDGAKALRLFNRLRAELQTDLLWQRTLDPSGPLNTASLILDQQELYMAMAEEPAAVHEFLGRVADFVIALWRYQMQASGNRVVGSIWPYIVFPQDLGIVVTEDLMPLLSANQYGECGLPIWRRIVAEFGGLAIHCCGKYPHQVPHLRALGPALRAIEFHHPYTTIEELAPLAEHTVFIPYLAGDKQDRFKDGLEFYRWLLAETPSHYRYWFALLDDNDATRAFVAEVNRHAK